MTYFQCAIADSSVRVVEFCTIVPYSSKNNKQSATVPKDVYSYRCCFPETKDRMHNEVGTCAEILP